MKKILIFMALALGFTLSSFADDVTSASTVTGLASGTSITLRDDFASVGSPFADNIQEGVPYLLKLKGYDLYMNAAVSANASVNLTATPTPVYFESDANGWKIRSGNGTGVYVGYKINSGTLSWSTIAVAATSDKVSVWTVLETTPGEISLDNYTTSQTTTNAQNHLGLGNNSETPAAGGNFFHDSKTGAVFVYSRYVGNGTTPTYTARAMSSGSTTLSSTLYLNLVTTSANGNATLNSTSNTMSFEPGTVAGTWKIKNANGKYLGHDTGNTTAKNVWNTALADTGDDWVVEEADNGYVMFRNYTNEANGWNAAVGHYLGVDATTTGSAFYLDKTAANATKFRLYIGSTPTVFTPVTGSAGVYYFNGGDEKTSAATEYTLETSGTNGGFKLKRTADNTYVKLPTLAPNAAGVGKIPSSGTDAVFYAIDVQSTNSSETTTVNGGTSVKNYCSGASTGIDKAVRFVTFVGNKATGAALYLCSGNAGFGSVSCYAGANKTDISTVWKVSVLATYTLSGTVKSTATGTPAVAGATVTLSNGATTTTDASGNYSFADLTAGDYTVTVTKTGFHSNTVNVSVSADKVQNISLNPIKYYTVSGKVTNSTTSAAIEGVSVKLTNANGNYEATTDASGNYSIANVADGEYSLVATATGYRNFTGGTVTVSANTTRNISMVERAAALRCLIRTTEDNVCGYLTNLIIPTAAVEEDLSYYSVWELQDNGDGTCEIFNVGTRDILAPQHTVDDIDLVSARNDGNLYYDSVDDDDDRFDGVHFIVGTPHENCNKILTLEEVSEDVYTFSGKENYYMYLDGNKDIFVGSSAEYTVEIDPGKSVGGWSIGWESDHLIKSATANAGGRYMRWQVIPLTPDREVEIFQNMVNNLTGCVGGVLTLSNVQGIDCLVNIKDYIEDAKKKILNENAQDGALRMQEVLRKIRDIKNDATNKKYYQELYADQPFFIEGICARPSYGARLAVETKKIYGYDRVVFSAEEGESINSNTPEGVFYITAIDDYYVMKNGNDKYLAGCPLKDYASGDSYFTNQGNVTTCDAVADAMHFIIEPVIPGVWMIKDVTNVTYTKTTGVTFISTSNPYLTINTEPVPHMLHYQPEISAMWKFRTYNKLEVNIEDLITASEGKDPNNIITTYCQGMNFQLNAALELQPYYVAEGAVNIKDGGKFDITLAPLTAQTIGGYNSYLLQYAEGYILRYEPKNHGWVDGTPLSAAATQAAYTADVAACGDKPILAFYNGKIDATTNSTFNVKGKNMLVGTLAPYFITSFHRYHDTYVLAYKVNGTQIGTWNYQPVTAVGTGFYHLAMNQAVPANKAYLSMSAFSGAQDGKSVRYQSDIEVSEEDECDEPLVIVLHFLNAEGEETGIMELPATDKRIVETGIIRDMQGRKVTNPVKGQIYIVGGKKVLF